MDFLTLVNVCTERELGQRPLFEESQGGSSCHQCKSRRHAQDLTFCSSSAKKNKTQCRKKYCNHCLTKFYQDIPTLRNEQGWLCPFCRDMCCCAACRRRENAASSPRRSSRSPPPRPAKHKTHRRLPDSTEGADPPLKKSCSPTRGRVDPEAVAQTLEGAKLLANLTATSEQRAAAPAFDPQRPAAPELIPENRPPFARSGVGPVNKVWRSLVQMDGNGWTQNDRMYPHAPRTPCQCPECVHGRERGMMGRSSSYYGASQRLEYRDTGHCSCCSHRRGPDQAWERSSSQSDNPPFRFPPLPLPVNIESSPLPPIETTPPTTTTAPAQPESQQVKTEHETALAAVVTPNPCMELLAR